MSQAPDRVGTSSLLFYDRPQHLGPDQRSRWLLSGPRWAPRCVRPSVPGGGRPRRSPTTRFRPERKVAGARRFLRGTVREWGADEDTTDAAVRCVSELVTNALIQTHGGCTVRVLLGRGVLTTTVRDGGTSDPGAPEPLVDPLRVHGHGLELVDAVAPRWGSELDSAGTTIWFVLEP